MVKSNNEGPSYLIDDALVKIEREQGMNRRTFVKGGVALAAMLAMGGAMGTYAWFTGREVKENKTSIAENLEIEVVEPNFPESGVVENVVPGAVIPKDPAVVNKSDVLNGYLFTEIRVPIAEVLVEGKETAERLPLFSFEVNEGWKLLQEFEDGDEKVFRYGWTEVVNHGGQTGSVFDTVTFVNLKDSAQGLDVGEQLVKVIGYGIQDAEAFEGDVAKAWNAYKLQNGITDGEPAGTVGRIDIVLNTNYIKEGETFDLARNELTNVVATTECVEWGSVSFERVPVVVDQPYSILPSGLSEPTAEDVIGDIMFDATTVDDVLAAGSVALEDALATFALHGKTDNVFRFYKRRELPPYTATMNIVPGASYDGIEYDYVFMDIESPTFKLGDGWGGSAIEVVDEGIRPVSMSHWFDGFREMRTIDLSKFDLSVVTDMSYLLANCDNLTSIVWPRKQISQVENMSHMLNGCWRLPSVDLSVFDTRNVNDMSGLFSGCSTMLSIDVSTLDTSSVTNMSYMFASLSGLVEPLNLTDFDTSSVTDMSYMFWYYPLDELDVSTFDTSNVENMNNMFSHGTALKSLSLGEFDTSSVTNMGEMFAYCTALTLNCRDWDVTNVTSYKYFNNKASKVVAPMWKH